MKHLLPILYFCLLCSGCNSLKSVKQALLKTSPYEEYVQSLGKAGLKETLLAKKWLQAGEDAFKDSIVVTLPFSETGFFESGAPQARAYRFRVYAGQVMTVSGQVKTTFGAHVFADLFIWKDDHWQSFIHADSGLNLSHEFDKEQLCLLRIQPELLTDTWYSLNIAVNPALVNPVKGATNRSIGSFYGNARDAGKRSHEGIDIFAPRGTPVIAPANGMVYSAGTNNLGGKIIWLYDLKRGQSYYFAHLDSQWVSAGQNIKLGDTLGQVGNTGNAIHTAAHLHFGIYRSGSKDPLYYVQTTERAIRLPLDTVFRAQVYKVSVKEGLLHTAPEKKSAVLHKVAKGTYLKQIAQTKDWRRVTLANGQQAYISGNNISLASKGQRLEIKNADTLWSEANPESVPFLPLKQADVVELLAQYKNYGYVKTRQSLYGWIKM